MEGQMMKAFIYTSSALWIVALIVLLYGIYRTGVEHGKLQGLECGTDTECEVLADILSRR
jgi:hypothetical protein